MENEWFLDVPILMLKWQKNMLLILLRHLKPLIFHLFQMENESLLGVPIFKHTRAEPIHLTENTSKFKNFNFYDESLHWQMP